MKRFWQKPFVALCAFTLFTLVPQLFAADTNDPDLALSDIVAGITGIKVGGQWFLTFENGKEGGNNFNEFAIQRGYIIINKTFNSKVSARITPDISVDQEGDGIGDLEMRLKYCFLKYGFEDFGFITKPYFELGLVHRPWLDFEQKINPYRVQGKMFLERQGIFNSGDYGVLFAALLGGEMDSDYKHNVNKNYPGKFGSFAIGILNGGGYHGVEANENKTIESRLSIRPLPEILPGLQFSYTGVIGKGNTIAAPNWRFNSGFISYETRKFVATGMVYKGTGDYRGIAINEKGIPLDQKGYSIFGNIKLPGDKFSIFGRHDFFNMNTEIDNSDVKTKIVGLTYFLIQGCKFIIDYDFSDYSELPDYKESKIQTAIEVKF